MNGKPSTKARGVRGQRGSNTGPIVAVVLGLLVTAVVTAITGRDHWHATLDELYDHRARPFAMLLEGDVERQIGHVRALAATYTSYRTPSRNEFADLVSITLDNFDGIRALEWVPRVEAPLRQSFEQAARHDGLADFAFREIGPDGPQVAVGRRDEYYPVFLVEPLYGNEQALGLDLASNPERREAMDLARDMAQPIATRPLRLVQEAGEDFGFLVFHPVFRGNTVPITLDDRQRRLAGFTVGVFSVDELVRATIGSFEFGDDLDFHLYDASVPAAELPMLHWRHDERETVEQSSEDLIAGESWSTSFDVAGRRWKVVFVPREPGLADYLGPGPIAWAAIGLILTAVLGTYIASTGRRTRKIAGLVAARTGELNRTNLDLRAEVSTRIAAETALAHQNAKLRLMQIIASAANDADTVRTALRVCVEEVCAFLGWPIGHAFVRAPGAPNTFVPSEIWHLSSPVLASEFVARTRTMRFAMGEGLVGATASTQRARWLHDVSEEPAFVRASVGDQPPRAALFLPVIARGEVVAVLEFFDLRPAMLDEQVLGLMNQIGLLVGRVAERETAAAELSAREEFTRLVTDSVPVVIFYVDSDHRLVFANRLFGAVLQRPLETLLGQPLLAIFGGEALAIIEPYIQAALSGDAQSFDVDAPPGAIFAGTWRSTYVPHRTADGHVAGFFGIATNVTERLQIERQLMHAQKMEAVGHLTGGIAHDFNNLLMIIDGYARRAADQLDRPDRARQSLQEVLNGTDRATELTRKLLTFSRRKAMEKRVFRVADEIGRNLDLIRRSVGERYEVVFADGGNGACVETDPGEFAQALLNLVVNARDAMPGGGKIEIALGSLRIDATAATKDNGSRRDLPVGRYVEVTVIDHGQGIPPDVLPHVFEPFYTTKDQGKGTGLGLPMVYGFATQSGGTAEIESVADVLTTARIVLPATDRELPQESAVPAVDCKGHGETILLVEDDTALLDLTESTLQSLGYNVLAANGGFEALEMEQDCEGDIDLLLSDVVMPELGGFEVAQMIRASRPDIKVVFMSGYPNRGQAADERMPDGAVFLQKPVRPDRLAQSLRMELDS
ncbi:MAG: CHASE domain-containing protein [Alphaproteobacteria bacterium]